MFNIIVFIAAFSVIGWLITVVLGLLRQVGLGFITDFALRMIFYDRKAYFNNYVLWNKLWLRFGVLALVLMFIGTIVAFFLRPITPKSYGGSAWFYATLLVTGAYAYWIRAGKSSLLAALQSERDTTPEVQTGFEFSTQGGILQLRNIFRGIFICGGPGSGKSKSLIEPIIQQAAAANFTGILYDRKFR